MSYNRIHLSKINHNKICWLKRKGSKEIKFLIRILIRIIFFIKVNLILDKDKNLLLKTLQSKLWACLLKRIFKNRFKKVVDKLDQQKRIQLIMNPLREIFLV